MIQKHMRGYLCRKKLLPLILEIKKELGSLDTRSDLGINHFEIKTDDLEGKPDFYGNDFDKIFARDKDEEDDEPKALSIGKRILSDPKAYDLEKKNPFDDLKRKGKSKGRKQKGVTKRKLQIHQRLKL